MTTQLRSFQELYDAYVNEVKANAAALTDFTAGSINDVMAGAAATALSEASLLIADLFSKTFFDSANGSAITGSTDDLQTLAVDHYGTLFSRPLAVAASGIVTFSRASTAAGDVVIPVGTIVKSPLDSNGQSQRFATTLAVTMTGTSINASVTAVATGSKGNISSGGVTVIESTLTDGTVTVTNTLAMSGGAEAQDDPTYRQTIRNLIQQLKGATLAAVQAQALTVSGVVKAQPYEFDQIVINYVPATGLTSGAYFKIPVVQLYVADANGTANGALVAAVLASIQATRAAGVKINVFGATPLTINWTGHVALNPLGPNYATLSTNTSMITDSMTQYLQGLAIGASFSVATANAAMLAIWGPAGTNDLTSFSTSVPSGDVTAASYNAIVPGTVSLA